MHNKIFSLSEFVCKLSGICLECTVGKLIEGNTNQKMTFRVCNFGFV